MNPEAELQLRFLAVIILSFLGFGNLLYGGSKVMAILCFLLALVLAFIPRAKSVDIDEAYH